MITPQSEEKATSPALSSQLEELTREVTDMRNNVQQFAANRSNEPRFRASPERTGNQRGAIEPSAATSARTRSGAGDSADNNSGLDRA